jgi:hypothetical protein
MFRSPVMPIFMEVFLRSIHVLCIVLLLCHVNLSQVILSLFYILTHIMIHVFTTHFLVFVRGLVVFVIYPS